MSRTLVVAVPFCFAALAACAPPPVVPSSSSPPPAAPAATSMGVLAPSPLAPVPAPVEASGYDKPPRNVLDVLHAPSPPSPYINPTHDTILLASWVEYPPMSRVVEPFLRPRGSSGRAKEPEQTRHTRRVRRYALRERLRSRESGRWLASPCRAPPCRLRRRPHMVGRRQALRLPEPRGRCRRTVVGPCGERRGASRRQRAAEPDAGQHGAVDAGPDHASRQAGPRERRAPASHPTRASRPEIRESSGQKGQSSTYEARDTLTNKHDEDLFDYYASSQLAFVDADGGRVTPLGKVDLYSGVDAAPDGEHILMESIRKPYSYVTTFERFPHDVAIWDRTGR